MHEPNTKQEIERKLQEIALQNPFVHGALNLWRSGACTENEALGAAVVHLAEANERLNQTLAYTLRILNREQMDMVTMHMNDQ